MQFSITDEVLMTETQYKEIQMDYFKEKLILESGAKEIADAYFAYWFDGDKSAWVWGVSLDKAVRQARDWDQVLREANSSNATLDIIRDLKMIRYCWTMIAKELANNLQK